MFDTPFKKIFWSYGINQPKFFKDVKISIPNIEFINGFPENELEEDNFVTGEWNTCLVIGIYAFYKSKIKSDII